MRGKERGAGKGFAKTPVENHRQAIIMEASSLIEGYVVGSARVEVEFRRLLKELDALGLEARD